MSLTVKKGSGSAPTGQPIDPSPSPLASARIAPIPDVEIRRISPAPATPLGLAKHCLELHGLDITSAHPPVSVGNWIPAPLTPSQPDRSPPFHVPDPGADAYLAGLGVAALDSQEEAIVPRLIPGWAEHLQKVRILPPDAKIHEVDFQMRHVKCLENGAPANKLAGYPYTDILSQAIAQGIRLQPGQPVAATFPTPFVRQQIAQLGGTLIQGSDASLTNNKHLFREAAARYGYSVFPGAAILTPQDLYRQADVLLQISKKLESSGITPRYIARLKDPRSSGGDGVKGIEAPVTHDTLRNALSSILHGIHRSYLLGSYGPSTSQLRWNERNTESFPYPLVLEHDAATLGEVLFNGSFMVEIHADGTYGVPRIFGQKTDREGSFRGGYSVDATKGHWQNAFTPAARELLDRSIQGVVEYWYRELGVRGMAGVDFMLVQRYEDNAIVPYLFDPNVRPTINSISCTIARKVERAFGFTAWENINGWAPNSLTSMTDFEKLLNLGNGLDFYNGCDYGIVIPIAHRAMFNRDSHGRVSCVRGSNAAKFLIASTNESDVEAIADLLAEHRGLRYSSDEQ